MDAYSFLWKRLQKTALDDVCDGCIYNVQDECTFQGDANFAQLPVGCPKRPDTQKTFSLAISLSDERDRYYEYLEWREEIPKTIKFFKEEYLSNPMQEVDLEDFLAALVYFLENKYPYTEEIERIADEFRGKMENITEEEFREYVRRAIDELENVYSDIKHDERRSSDDYERFDAIFDEITSKADRFETEDTERLIIYEVDGVQESLPFTSIRTADKVFDQLYDLFEEISKANREGTISYGDDLRLYYCEKEEDDWVATDEVTWYKGKMSSRDSLHRLGQQFAPGPGPWEGSTTNEISQEVSRSGPERWDAGPFVIGSQSRVRMDTPLSRDRIAGVVRTLAQFGDNTTVNTTDSYQNNPVEPQNNPVEPQGNQEEVIVCLNCGTRVPKNTTTCPNCGYKMAKISSSYKLCYFCGQPVSKGTDYSLILNNSGEDVLGVAHLECSQTAASQYQGEFDDDGDFLLNEEAEKEPPSHEDEEGLQPYDEVVLVKDFEDLEAGELGRILSPPEVEEGGYSPVRVDDKLYVKFDKKPGEIELVPKDYLEKTTRVERIIKQALTMPCPMGFVPTVLVVLDHCYLASDDSDDPLGCHYRACKYWRPVSKAEWERLEDLELSNPLGLIRRVW